MQAGTASMRNQVTTGTAAVGFIAVEAAPKKHHELMRL